MEFLYLTIFSQDAIVLHTCGNFELHTPGKCSAYMRVYVLLISGAIVFSANLLHMY